MTIIQVIELYHKKFMIIVLWCKGKEKEKDSFPMYTYKPFFERVYTNNKKRYEYSPDGITIRAR